MDFDITGLIGNMSIKTVGKTSEMNESDQKHNRIVQNTDQMLSLCSL